MPFHNNNFLKFVQAPLFPKLTLLKNYAYKPAVMMGSGVSVRQSQGIAFQVDWDIKHIKHI